MINYFIAGRVRKMLGPSRRQVFWGLMELVGTPAAATTAASGFNHVKLMMMGSQDDPEAYVDMFEHTTKVWGWPE